MTVPIRARRQRVSCRVNDHRINAQVQVNGLAQGQQSLFRRIAGVESEIGADGVPFLFIQAENNVVVLLERHH